MSWIERDALGQHVDRSSWLPFEEEYFGQIVVHPRVFWLERKPGLERTLRACEIAMVKRINAHELVDFGVIGVDFLGPRNEVTSLGIFLLFAAFIQLRINKAASLSRQDAGQGDHHAGVIRLQRQRL